MLIKPMGYNPSTSNTFLSVLVLYFVNLIVPRAGEVARCTVLSQTDKVPFTKLVGTVFVERVADVIMLFVLAVFIFASNVSLVVRFFNENINLKSKVDTLTDPKVILIGVAVVLLVVFGTIFLIRKLMKSKLREKIIHLKDQFVEGIKTIAHMKRKWLFVFHTLSIFFLWLVMLYVVFLAYEPTSHLTIRVGMLVFLMGGLAMLAPVQGGIGPWHFMVIQTLLLFGISSTDGKIFAAIAHTSTNLIYLLIGGGALIFLLFKYGTGNIKLTKEENTEPVL